MGMEIIELIQTRSHLAPEKLYWEASFLTSQVIAITNEGERNLNRELIAQPRLGERS